MFKWSKCHTHVLSMHITYLSRVISKLFFFLFGWVYVCVFVGYAEKMRWGELTPQKNQPISFDPFVNCIMAILVNFTILILLCFPSVFSFFFQIFFFCGGGGGRGGKGATATPNTHENVTCANIHYLWLDDMYLLKIPPILCIPTAWSYAHNIYPSI